MLVGWDFSLNGLFAIFYTIICFNEYFTNSLEEIQTYDHVGV